MRIAWALLAWVAAVGGCSGGGGGDCEPTVVFLSRAAQTYTVTGDGDVDSTTNHISFKHTGGPDTWSTDGWPLGDTAWTQLLACARTAVGPYAIEVTDVDPGSAPHMEIAMSEPYMGTTGSTLSLSSEPCGVSEVGIAVVEEDATDVQPWCHYVSSSIAMLSGLEFTQSGADDDATVIFGGGTAFLDVDIDCFDQPCHCSGSTTQNSHEKMLAVHGPSCD